VVNPGRATDNRHAKGIVRRLQKVRMIARLNGGGRVMSKKWIVVFVALAVGTVGVLVTAPTTVVAQPAKDKDKAAPKEKMKKEPSEKQKAARATLKECSAKWKEHKKASGEKGMKAYVAFMRECRKSK
jgi:predicted metalloprotease